MRVIRTLMLVFGIAMAAGGCSQQPVLRYQMAAAPQGIDNVIYGAGRLRLRGRGRAVLCGTSLMRRRPMPRSLTQRRPMPTPSYATPSYATAAPSYGVAASPRLCGRSGGHGPMRAA